MCFFAFFALGLAFCTCFLSRARACHLWFSCASETRLFFLLISWFSNMESFVGEIGATSGREWGDEGWQVCVTCFSKYGVCVSAMRCHRMDDGGGGD